MAFGEAFSGVVEDERVVEVGGFGEPEELLEDAVDVGGYEEVPAAGDVGDLLECVVDDDGEVVGGADVLAGEHDVAEEAGVDGVAAEEEVVEGERAGESGGFPGVEPPGVGVAAVDAGPAVGGAELAAGSGVERAFGAMRGGGHAGDFVADFAAGAEARVDEAGGFQ